MPRRALALITGLVLAAHWLVLGGLPRVWQSPTPQPALAFSTRSITLPPPAPPPAAPSPPAATPAAAAEGAARPPAARKRNALAPQRSTPAPQPPSTPADIAPATAEADNLPSADEYAATLAEATAPTVPPAESVAAANPGAEPPPPSPAPPSPPAAASAEATTEAGVDIRAPGGGPGPAISTAAPPVRLPAPTRLAFDVTGQAKKFAYSASAELLWQHDGSRYEARQEISAFLLGKRTQRSAGNITAQGLQPERFSDRSRSEQAAHFDAAKGRVTFSANTPDAAVSAGAQDRLSVFIQLGALLAADPARFVPGTEIALTTVSARSADRWTFTIEGTETLDLPAGPTPALKLQRLPRKEYDQKAELWVAPALGYLPVRIRITQANGDFADLLLRSSGAP
jgi:hypothetical protein